MTRSRLEPPTDLLNVALSDINLVIKMLNSVRPSTDLKVQCLFTAIGWMMGSSKPFWACVQFSSHLIVYSSSPVHCFQPSHSSPVSMPSLYCFVKLRHLNCTCTCAIIILDFTARVNLLFRTFKFLCHFCLTHRQPWSLNLWHKTEVMAFPCEILVKYL